MGVDMGSVQTKMEVSNGGQSTPRSKPQACKVSDRWSLGWQSESFCIRPIASGSINQC